MPEITTCEQYVLNELFNTQKRNEELINEMDKLRYSYNEVSNENVRLKQIIKNLNSEEK